MNFFEKVESIFETWHYDHPRILYALIRSLKPEVVVEVGTYRGYAACYMAQALKENGKGHLFAIDDFSEGMQKKFDPEHWYNNLQDCDVIEYTTLLIGKSVEVVWPKIIDFAYIDGWHGYNTIVKDFENAASRGAECICLDDVKYTVGPALFVQRLRKDPRWDVCEIFRDCGLAICTRRQNERVITFSQESIRDTGILLTDCTTNQKKEFLAKLGEETKVDYTDLNFS